MRQLSNHLATCTMLNQQCILAAYSCAPRDIRHFNKQRSVATLDRRYATVNDAFFSVHLSSTEAHFVCIVIACFDDATEDVAQLGFIVDKLQQGFALRTLNADTKNVFGGRVQADDQQTLIEKNDAATQAVEDLLGVFIEAAIVTGALRRAAAYLPPMSTELCCT